MTEKLPWGIGFNPWHPATGSLCSISPEGMQQVRTAGEVEIAQDFMAQCCLDSMYFSGKGLAKCTCPRISSRFP